MHFSSRTKKFSILFSVLGIMALMVGMTMAGGWNGQPSQAKATASSFPSAGGLDCNGDSQIQKLIKPDMICEDFVGYDGKRGFDNGHYVGHDEPTVNFFSNSPGSGNNMQWKITLPKEHALPATQTFENYITFWFSIDLCDPNSYPQNPCIPDSDKNPVARFSNDPMAAGGAFLELQFYPPGFTPLINKISCDLTHWCAAMNIDSLECTANLVFCNPKCTEPVNFALIQTNGVPAGPPGPANQTNATFTPNAQTLLMNQGDTLKVTVKDTPAGMLNSVDDLSSGKSGFMVASAQNGFQHLNVHTCAPANFGFHPEFSTTKFGNFLSWGIGQSNLGFDYEVGHFTPGRHGDNDSDDAPCFAGPTLPGCLNFATGGDLDFDGTSYLQDWPDGTKFTASPSPLSSVLGNGFGPVSSQAGQTNYTHGYPAFQFDTDLGAFEKNCKPDGEHCVAPPPGATFYPFFAQAGKGANCTLTFGTDIRGLTTNDFGRDAEYGRSNPSWTSLDISSGIQPNPCTPR